MAMMPTVYFIDDSATMREVIKIAFRRENINVLTSHDAVLALEEIERNRPDIVITDVIMPVKDGYEVCQFIKTHPELAKIPVVLMSGVVNRAVAERAFAVKADELLRKPFQPQDLISRVRNLLISKGAPKTSTAATANASAVLSNIFSTPAAMPSRAVAPIREPGMAALAVGPFIAMLEPRVPDRLQAAPAMSVAAPFSVVVPDVDPLLEVPGAPATVPAPSSSSISAAVTPFAASNALTPGIPAAEAMTGVSGPTVTAAVNGTAVNGSAKAPKGDFNRPRIEILRLEGLVKKLQAELQAEREYSKALEAHIKTLQEPER